MSLLLLFGGAGIPPVYLTPPTICYPTTATVQRGDVDRGETNTILGYFNTSAMAYGLNTSAMVIGLNTSAMADRRSGGVSATNDRSDGGVSAMNDRFDGGTSAAADRADGGTSANVKTCMLGGGS